MCYLIGEDMGVFTINVLYLYGFISIFGVWVNIVMMFIFSQQESRSTANTMRSTVSRLEDALHKSEDQIREVRIIIIMDITVVLIYEQEESVMHSITIFFLSKIDGPVSTLFLHCHYL